MFTTSPPLSDEDKANIQFGFLPSVGQIAQIISAHGWYAHFRSAQEENVYEPLMAWAILRNGNALPMVYEPRRRACVIAFAVTGYCSIVHEDDFEDEDNNDDDTYKKGVKK